MRDSPNTGQPLEKVNWFDTGWRLWSMRHQYYMANFLRARDKMNAPTMSFSTRRKGVLDEEDAVEAFHIVRNLDHYRFWPLEEAQFRGHPGNNPRSKKIPFWINQWYEVEALDRIRLCVWGMHGSPAVHMAAEYMPTGYLTRVSLCGVMEFGVDKMVAQYRRVNEVYHPARDTWIDTLENVEVKDTLAKYPSYITV